jgi:hypothetical protein
LPAHHIACQRATGSDAPDEWRAYLADIPGGLSQLAVALGYWIRIPLLRKAVGAPAFGFQASRAISKADYVLRRRIEAFNNVVKTVSAVFEIVETVVDVLRDVGEGAMGGGIFIGWLGGILGGILGGAGAMGGGFGGGFGGGMLSGTIVGIVIGTIGTIVDMVLQNRTRGSTSPTRSRSSTGS